jgi:hypothetical protein
LLRLDAPAESVLKEWRVLLRRDDVARTYVQHLIERIVIHHDGRIVITPKTGGRTELAKRARRAHRYSLRATRREPLPSGENADHQLTKKRLPVGRRSSVARDLGPGLNPARVTTPLMRLQDPALTHVVIVTLPETTPVSQAAALQEDLRRAKVEPFAWVVNRSLSAAGARDPLLAAKLNGERRQLERIATGLAKRVFVVPWLPNAPVGADTLGDLAGA